MSFRNTALSSVGMETQVCEPEGGCWLITDHDRWLLQAQSVLLLTADKYRHTRPGVMMVRCKNIFGLMSSFLMHQLINRQQRTLNINPKYCFTSRLYTARWTRQPGLDIKATWGHQPPLTLQWGLR